MVCRKFVKKLAGDGLAMAIKNKNPSKLRLSSAETKVAKVVFATENI
jgi:hypothetical protein